MAVALILVMMSAIGAFAAVRDTDVSAPGDGNVFVLVPGEFEKADVKAILDLINSYRKEACEKGYPKPGYPSVKLTPADYRPVKWSGDLEWIAQTRAAEGAVYQSHARPCGRPRRKLEHNGVRSYSETLAWNYDDLITGIQQWYEEKEDWINQNQGAVVGHYTIMISLDTAAIGIGCFSSEARDWTCVAGEYSTNTDLSEAPQGVYGKCEQKMEVKKSSLSPESIKGKSSVTVGKSASYSVKQTVEYPGKRNGQVSTPVSVNVTEWRSSDPGIASISKDGRLTAVGIGNVKIQAILSTGVTVSKTVSIRHPAKGESILAGNVKYKVKKTGSEVAYYGCSSAKGKVTVPATVKYYGRKYKVTSIAASALKGNRKVTSVIIGKNVKSIGKAAFYKCTRLKTLTIKSRSLTATKTGSKAFTGTKIRKIKCPKGKKAAYKKILIKKGIKRSAAFK